MASSTPIHRRLVWADIFHNELTAWIVLAVSLLLTVLGALIAAEYAAERAQTAFRFEVEDARQRILKRMFDYEQVLRGGIALNETLGRVPTRQEWHSYVANIDIQTYFPGIQGIGFSVMLRPEQLAEHEAKLRREGFADYRVRPEGKRDQYSAIVFLEPFDWRNQRAFGYDMFSESVRRNAMEMARDSGAPAVSGRVTLVQETEKDVQAGFLMYLPYYQDGMPTATVEQRRQALVGFVYSPFRAADLMGGILGSESPELGFELFDGNGTLSEDTMLYESNPEHALYQSKYNLSVPIDLRGRTWTARFHSRPRFDAEMASSQPLLIGIGGSIVDLLLFTIIWSLAGERKRVQRKAEAMTQALRTAHNRLLLAQEAAGIGIWDYRPTDGSLIWDDRMCALYGLQRGEFANRYADWTKRVHPDDLSKVSAQLTEALEGADDLNIQFRILLPSDEIRVLEAHAAIIRDEAGVVQHVIGINRDVTERSLTEDRLRLAASVFDSAREGIIITDPSERILAVNPTFTELTGYSRDDVLGKTPRMFKSGHQSPEFYQHLWQQLAEEGFWQGEVWNRRKDGEVFAELLNISAVSRPDGSVTHYVATFSDITLLKEQQHRLERMAHYDALTQLPNRVLLADRMRQAMAYARREGCLLAVCYLDLDGFKPVNDRYGHEAGDRLLVHVAQRLRDHLREIDSVARLGGDEFVLLLNGLKNVEECEHALGRLVETMGMNYEVVAGESVALSASIGATLYPADDADTDTLLRHADQAMYQAKQAGRDRYFLFDPEHDRQARMHRDRINRIEAALHRGEFRLYYQPKVDMRQGRVLGAEALVRWQHPERGLLSPDEFLPPIAGSTFEVELGEWVLRSAFTQLTAWLQMGLRLTLSINIAGRHLQEARFAEKLGDLLEGYPLIEPGLIELEVLETTALEDIDLVSAVIEQCRGLGVSVAIDDFGTGYSSLTYLKRLPVDTLKIDQTFVRDMLTDTDDLAIIEGIIGLTQAFRREVIAEGVESDEHGALLLRLGCDLGQGYGIAPPMPPEQIPDWVRGYRQREAWSRVGQNYWMREDLPLLSAELEHRRWVDDLIASLESGSELLHPPEMDHHHCRFGQWYEGQGRARYGELEEFRTIGPLHDQIHILGHELLHLERAGKRSEALGRIDELRRLRTEIFAHLRALQAVLARRNDALRETG